MLEAPSLTLITLGGARLVGPAVTSSERGLLEVGKPLALIAFICASPGRQARRDLLLDLLWADLEPDAAKHALRQTLWYIKKRVGDGIIAATSDVVSVSDAIAVDRDALLAASEANDHPRVVGLYAGEFLPNFATPGGAEFEKWAEIERRRLRLIFLRSAEARVHELLGKGRPREALGIARMARDADPLAQAGWRLVLEVLSAARDWAQARMEADAFEQMVGREELEFEPASRAQLRVARGGESMEPARSESQPSAPAAELVGREREFALLLEGVEAAQRGRGRHIHLRAPAGIGKTRLLVDLQARLRGARTRAALVRCDMGSREIPYAAASEIARALGVLPGARGISPDSASALVAMTPSLSAWFSVPNDAASGAEALRRRGDALAELASAVADEQALVLLVDDVHWMDRESRVVLGQLATRVSAQHMLLVTAGRPSADGRIDSGQAQVIELHPLTEVQCGELVASIASTGAPSLPRRFVSELWRATRGSPLHVLEMLQLLRERNLLWAESGEWRTSSGEQLLSVLREGAALERRLESLPRESRWLLILLAAAGAPAPAPMLSAAGGGFDERTQEWLIDLEQRGLVARAGGEWELAHDEVGEAAFEHTGGETVRAAHAALGRWLLESAADDAPSMRRAAQHLAQGGETGALHALYARFVSHARALGDQRPLHALADDLLGRHASAELARGLVRSLPLTARLGLSPAWRVGAAAALLLAVAAGINAMWGGAARSDSDSDFDVAVVTRDSVGTMRVVDAPIVVSRWKDGEPIDIDLDRRPLLEVPNDVAGGMPVPGPNGDRWLEVRVVNDSGINDIFLLERGKEARRLTFTPGDDNMPSWSPDGRYVVFNTARWRPQDSHYDLAILDLEQDSTYQLTGGEDSDTHGLWSPRGHRIAFARKHWNDTPTSACTVGVDGRDSSCVAPRDAALEDLSGWYDEETLVAVVRQGDERLVTLLRLRDGSWRPLDRLTTNGAAVLSADGRWLICQCDRVGIAPGEWMLVPIAHPGQARPLHLPVARTGPGHLSVQFVPTPSTQLVDSVQVDSGALAASVGVPHRLLLNAFLRSGSTMRATGVRWSVDDTATATIDPSTGVLLVKRPGAVRVSASMSGWRSASITVRATQTATQEALADDWSRGIGNAWLPFGTPSPRTEPADGAHALFVNGDESYASGVLSRATFDVTDGLVVETRLSTPVSRMQWQFLNLSLTEESGTETSTEQRLLGNLAPMERYCGFAYPVVEGPKYADTLMVGGDRSRTHLPAPAKLRTGSWYDVTLVQLADGRCAIFLDGKLTGIASGGPLPSPTMRLHLGGMSVGTHNLFGPIRITRGIPTKVAELLAASGVR